MNNDRLGELDDTGLRLRFVRHLAHPPEVVWRSLTEPDRLDAWFPQQVQGRFEAGGTIRFGPRSGEDHEAFEGEVTACEPPTLLEYRWGADLLRFEITPDEGGSTLVFTDLLDEPGKAARDGAGWHECLDLLIGVLDGEGSDASWGERWRVVHPRYVQAFGPRGSTIGPPQDRATDRTTTGPGD